MVPGLVRLQKGAGPNLMRTSIVLGNVITAIRTHLAQNPVHRTCFFLNVAVMLLQHMTQGLAHKLCGDTHSLGRGNDSPRSSGSRTQPRTGCQGLNVQQERSKPLRDHQKIQNRSVLTKDEHLGLLVMQ